MKLTISGIQDTSAWQQAGITLPNYDVKQLQESSGRNPRWIHFGAGNIFRMFIGGIADQLIAQGLMESGIACAETFDFDIVDKIYKPYDNLVLAVTLNADGTTDKRVIGSLTEAIKAQASLPEDWARLVEIFTNPDLQMVSFTITEKGYALKDATGAFFSYVQADLERGPQHAVSAMAVVTALLYERFLTGGIPVAVVSMDNCSHNGEKLRSSIITVAEEWAKRSFVPSAFLLWLEDESKVSFPWSMIDKITPRPADSVCEELKKNGVEAMDPIITSKKTYIAPFVNAEKAQYLVIEDHFPNGRPPLEKAGVYMTNRDTVNMVERMKVTTCLNPLHTALAVYGCLLGYHLIADEMKDPELTELIRRIGLVEGMPVVTDPGILSPTDFLQEVIHERFPNPFMPDSPQRIATDTSQKVGIRFGETIKAYIARNGTAASLTAIPLAIAGWCRYLLAVDDEGHAFDLSPDPMAEELTAALQDVKLGQPESYRGQLKAILSNVNIFGSDLYAAGIGEKIEQMFVEEIVETGAVRNTLKKYLT